MKDNDVTVQVLDTYSSKDVHDITALLPSLNAKFDGMQINEDLLKDVILSPFHTQIAARINGHIVGIATLSTTMGPAAGRKLYLEDFVVDTAIQGRGIGGAIWRMIEQQCRDKHLPLHFTSRPARKAAHDFYLNHGATIYDTTVFHWDATNE